MTSGILNFLEPSGPLQAYNGTDLPYWINKFYPQEYVSSSTHQPIHKQLQNMTACGLRQSENTRLITKTIFTTKNSTNSAIFYETFRSFSQLEDVKKCEKSQSFLYSHHEDM